MTFGRRSSRRSRSVLPGVGVLLVIIIQGYARIRSSAERTGVLSAVSPGGRETGGRRRIASTGEGERKFRCS